MSPLAFLPLLLIVVPLTWLLVRGTMKKGKMGVNLAPPTNCPRCQIPLPQVRLPTSFRQMMWGGWTCKSCGCEMDKWGRVIER
jgi:hypothetical protein